MLRIILIVLIEMLPENILLIGQNDQPHKFILIFKKTDISGFRSNFHSRDFQHRNYLIIGFSEKCNPVYFVYFKIFYFVKKYYRDKNHSSNSYRRQKVLTGRFLVSCVYRKNEKLHSSIH